MKGPKLLAAKQATGVAVDCLPDGVRFAVLGGNHSAQVVYPPQPPLAVSSSETRSAAKAAVMKLEAGGGTAIGTWIELAAMLLRDEPGIRHAILLTDGKNESEQPEAFERRLWDAKGSFQCDCRGVGKDWSVAELRSVATALVGTYDIVATPDGLAADFSRMLRDSLSRQVGEVALRVWTPQGGQVLVLKQMDPLLELTDNRVEVDPLRADYATGAWGDETRDYYLSVRVPVADEERLAARVILLVDGEEAGQGLVKAEWTDDASKSTQMNKRVAEALGQSELADEIQKGVDAHREGDDSGATDRWGRAVRLAHELGNSEVVDRLSTVVDIVDAPTGRVRLKPKIDEIDVMLNETRSTRTSRRRRDPRDADDPEGGSEGP